MSKSVKNEIRASEYSSEQVLAVNTSTLHHEDLRKVNNSRISHFGSRKRSITANKDKGHRPVGRLHWVRQAARAT